MVKTGIEAADENLKKMCMELESVLEQYDSLKGIIFAQVKEDTSQEELIQFAEALKYATKTDKVVACVGLDPTLFEIEEIPEDERPKVSGDTGGTIETVSN